MIMEEKYEEDHRPQTTDHNSIGKWRRPRTTNDGPQISRQ